MIKKLLVILVILLVSCEKMPLTPQEMILGNWVEVKKKPDTDDMLPPPPDNDTLSYEFKCNGICEYKKGYFDYERFYNDTSSERVLPYLGTKTTYNLKSKNLNIYNPSSKKWINYKIKYITSDSLLINNGSDLLFVKKHYNAEPSCDFDTVILSSDPCYGACPVNNIMIDEGGNVTYQGIYAVANKGFYLGKIKPEDFDNISKPFQQADYLNLKSGYFATHTDGSTVYVTFVKHGKIIKTIEDYSSAAPKEFVWAYDPLIYKVQNIKLESQKSFDFLNTDNSNFFFSRFHLDLSTSESFYLLSKLRAGKITNNEFEEKYEMYYYNKLVKKVMTDGRIYRFYLKDESQKTIDIGFNFLKANENNKELN